MKVLVTGADGFIGGQLMHALWKNGHTAIGVDNYSYGSADNLHFDDHDFSADVIKMDIRDKEGMKALFEQEKFDIVYNIAGIAPLPDCQSDPVEAVSVNTLGLVNVLENARRTGVKHVIQASTNAMYENETEFPTFFFNDKATTEIYTVRWCGTQAIGIADVVIFPCWTHRRSGQSACVTDTPSDSTCTAFVPQSVCTSISNGMVTARRSMR